MTGRANQRLRTRNAIVQAAVEVIRSGGEVTMPDVARAALVSDATAYRYFPDLASLFREALGTELFTPAEALVSVAESTDPVERVAVATEHLLRHVLRYQAAVRAMISATITRPDGQLTRPGLRFGLIDEALSPVTEAPELEQLKRALAVVVSAEALFSLTDLYGLPPDEAIASLVSTATMITKTYLGTDR
jgi:AcrR family transcriptional regulator